MSNWRRVSKDCPCPACGKKDWCTLGEKYAVCMRVQSDKPCKNGGWFHPLDSKPAYVPPARPEPPPINSTRLIAEWADQTKGEWLRRLAESLGVSAGALACLSCCWAAPHRAWAFPMRDGYGEPVGIRLRAESGKKWAVTGSHQGIFIPAGEPKARAYICEGPTDTAALLSLGVFAIGRPSCSGGNVQLATALKRLGVREAVIIADNDAPGLAGAEKLTMELRIPTCILIPPSKDIREFVKLGGTAELLQTMTQGILWHQPNNHND